MILIISINYDYSTSIVAEWLLHYDRKFEIITETEIITDLVTTIDAKGKVKINFKLSNGKTFDLSRISSFWYRRNKFLFVNDIPNPELREFKLHLDTEYKKLGEYLFERTETIGGIGSYFNSDPNKLLVLQRAAKVGLDVPMTAIVTSRDKLRSYFLKRRFINKNISEVINFKKRGRFISSKTIEVNFKNIEKDFAPSLFQELVPKKYELRIFFLREEFYAMAIFSQMDNQTCIDFRNYNYRKPNRTVPFKLPTEVQKKLTCLMKELGYNTGSIDMIVTPEDKYVFLEVNPVGQFGMVSKPCNYFIERKIAQTLIRKP